MGVGGAQRLFGVFCSLQVSDLWKFLYSIMSNAFFTKDSTVKQYYLKHELK